MVEGLAANGTKVRERRADSSMRAVSVRRYFTLMILMRPLRAMTSADIVVVAGQRAVNAGIAQTQPAGSAST